MNIEGLRLGVGEEGSTAALNCPTVLLTQQRASCVFLHGKFFSGRLEIGAEPGPCCGAFSI